jgi:NAD(P)-dependent dehydrogenase (short-subunit alcohol dehydrogenase family)
MLSIVMTARPETSRAALVTGAASGLGLAVARRLGADGWRVAGVDLREAPSETCELALAADVTREDEVARAVEVACERFGRLDAVAACAGINASHFALAHRLPVADWQRLLDVNLNGAYITARAVLPHLSGSGGSLVLVSSVSAHHALPGAAHYSAGKAGVVALAHSLALEYAPAGVRVNSVAPGYMDTAMAAPVLSRPEVRARLEASIPLGRIAAPEDVAAVVVWLLSADAGYITGQDLVVDGGLGLTTYSSQGLIKRLWDEPERG